MDLKNSVSNYQGPYIVVVQMLRMSTQVIETDLLKAPSAGSGATTTGAYMSTKFMVPISKYSFSTVYLNYTSKQ